MNFAKSIQKIKENKRIIAYAFMFFAVFYLLGDISFAAEPNAGTDTKFENLKGTVSTVGDSVLSGLSTILALFMYLSTIFLSPSWINGSLFGLNGYFKDIWILVSNLVYFIFAFILIWIAFMNIIGKSSDQYQLKQALPKFIVGVLIVPFSWFLVQFILSISAVLTVASLSLPFETFETYHTAVQDVQVPTNCTLDLRSKKAKETSGAKDEGYFYCTNEKNPSDALSISELGGTGKSIDSIFGIIAMYNYGILGLDRTDGIEKIDMSIVNTMTDLVVKIVFDLLFVLIYSILMIAIGLVLMVRGIYIWIYIMISPVFGLMYFFDKKDGGGDGFFAKFNIKEFIALAMVPVYTMLALSFGMLFLFIVGTGMTTKGVSPESGGGVQVEEKKVVVGKFTLNIEGQVSKLDNTTNLLQKFGGDSLGIVGSLILKVFGIVILWGAVMAAMRTSEITKTITQPLHDFGAQVGKIMTSAPANLPIFKAPGMPGQSMRSLQQVGNMAESQISTFTNDRANRFWDQTPFANSNVTKENNRLKSEIIRGGDETRKAELAKEILKSADGDYKNLHSNNGTKENLYELAKKILNSDELQRLNINKSSDINSPEIVAKLYEAFENKGGPFVDILPENSGFIDKNAIKKAVEYYKNNNVSSSSTTNNTNIRVDVNGVLSGLGVRDVQLNKDSTGKYNTTGDDAYVAKNIDKIKQNGLIDDFTDNLLDNLRKYYKDDGTYDSSGTSSGKFPWEINNP